MVPARALSAAPADAPPSSHTAIAPALLALLVTFLGLQPLATDLYLPSLPALAADLGVTAAAAQLTLSVFIASFGIAQLFVGPLSDRFGRRPLVLGGLSLYLGASLLGALATSLAWLVLARGLQAIGVCCTVLCARAIVRDLYEPEAGARVMARALGWMTLITLCGPIAGGLVLQLAGWRAAFATLALIGCAVLAGAARRLAESNRHRNREATRLRPLVANYAAILRSRDFRAYALVVTGSYCCLFSFISGSSFVLIRVLDVAPATYGALFGCVTLGFLLGTLLMRRLQPRLGIAGTVRVGGLIAAAAGLSMAALALAGVQSVPAIVVPMFFVLAAHGVLQPGCQVGAIAAFPRNAGSAAALLGFAMHLAAALVGWWIGASHDGSTRPMALTIGAIGALTAMAAWLLARPRGIEDTSRSGPSAT
jgi:DHA1 family bicyclomycin/chloramphenicol resistance-like MFS transporter